MLQQSSLEAELTGAESPRWIGSIPPVPPPIAIVGIGCRLPGGVSDPDEYWELLQEGRDAIIDIPAARWDVSKFYESTGAPGKSRVQRGGFLGEPVDSFDAAFFGISPREADHIDPQQRLLLEVAWEALENAGLPLERVAGTPVSVFVGGFTLDYSQLQFSLAEGEPSAVAAHTATGVVMTMMANRISHAFDLVGPSMAVDTACSSSLVAVHLACRSLWSGESPVALAGGVNLMLSPNFTIAASQGGFLSPTSQSRAFDASANGYVRGEGAGIVVLKPMADALRDGDRVYATIRATAVSQDGRTQGITVPNGASQERAMRAALAMAGVPAQSIAYVEAHGTGTPVGDPIEANAIGRVYRGPDATSDPCLIASAKTNIGHLEAAAGVAGLIKAALAVHHREVPPHLNLETVNPAIDLDQLGLRIPRHAEKLPEGQVLAAVNSFGFGGTNAHVIIESAPDIERLTTEPLGRIGGLMPVLPFAARTSAAVKALAGRYADSLDDEPGDLADLGSALAHRRTHHRGARLAIVADSAAAVSRALRAVEVEAPEANAHIGSGELDSGQLAFVFTGMGPQWWGMGRELLSGNAVYRAAIERCDAALAPLAGWSLMDELRAGAETSRMSEAAISQPANFALQVALAELWAELGVRPELIVGHSAGEVAAAYVAGALSFDDAVTVIYHRARLQDSTSGQGRLLAIALEPAAAAELDLVRSGRLDIAAVNSPQSVALVGAVEDLALALDEFERQGVFARLVDGNVPYHSRAMDPLESELRACLTGLRPTAPTIPLYSTVTGARMSDGDVHDAAYWWRNVREPVRFGDAAAAMIADNSSVMLELGPNTVLAHAIGDCLRAAGRRGSVIPSLSRKQSDDLTIAQASAALYAAGRDLDWSAWYPQRSMRTLPAYPWRRDVFWMETERSREHRLGLVDQELLGSRVDSASPSWRRVMDGSLPTYLADHRVLDAPLFPGAGYAEIAIEVARAEFGAQTCSLENLLFEAPLVMRAGGTYLLDTCLDERSATVDISGRTPESSRWVRHAQVRITPAPTAPATVDLDSATDRCPKVLDAEQCYASFRAAGFDYGPAFQSLAEVRYGTGEAVGRFVEGVADLGAGHLLHPVVLDGCFQLLLPLAIDQVAEGTMLIPVGVDRIALHATPHRLAPPAAPSGALHAHATVTPSANPNELCGDVVLATAAGQVLVEVRGFRVRMMRQRGEAGRLGSDWLYEQRWDEQERSEPAATIPAATTPDRVGSGVWLVLADRRGVADALAPKLAQTGDTVVLARMGADYDHGDEVVIRPDDRDHLRRVLDALPTDTTLRGVIHAWSLDAALGASDTDISDADLVWPAHDAPLSLVHVAQELDARGIACPVSIVTVGAQPIGDDHMTAAGLRQSPLWGMGRVLHHESLSLGARLIDLDPANPLGDVDWLAEEILEPQTDGEDQLARRQGQRYVARLYPSARAGGRIPRALRHDATYLITGGLGSLGLIFGVWLAERGARHLVLTGRSGLPPRAEWNALAPDEPRTEAIRAVRRMEAAGAQVDLAAIDVADARAMRALVEDRRAAGAPPIAGVIHAAGTVRDQIVLRLEENQLGPVLGPKILGSWALHTATLDEPLDFFVLFSSISAVVSTPGQGNYAAGNAFVDALAHYRRALGRPGLSINWGPWDVGMIATLGLQELYTRRGIDLIDEQTGIDIFADLLGSSEVQQGVVSAHWPSVISNYPIVPKMIEHLGQTAASVGDAGPSVTDQLSAAEPAQHPTIVAAACAEVIGGVLRIPPEDIDPDEALNRVGLDSMIAAEVRIRIEQAIGVAPSVVFMLRDATLATIADFIVDALHEAGDDGSSDIDGLADGNVEDLAGLLADLDDADIAQLFADLEPPAAGGSEI